MYRPSITTVASDITGKIRRDRLLFSQVFIFLTSVLILFVWLYMLRSLSAEPSSATDDMGSGLYFFFVIIPTFVYATIGFSFAFIIVPVLREYYDVPQAEEIEESSRKKAGSWVGKVVISVYVLPASIVLYSQMRSSLSLMSEGVPGTQLNFIVTAFLLSIIIIVVVVT